LKVKFLQNNGPLGVFMIHHMTRKEASHGIGISNDGGCLKNDVMSKILYEVYEG